VDIPATLASRVRLLGSGRSEKNDPNDARSVAIAALRATELVAVRVEDHATVLRLLAGRHTQLGWAYNKTACRFHAVVAELVPGGIGQELVVSQARSLIDGLQPVGAVAIERHALAVEMLDELERLNTQRKALRKRIVAAAAASGTTLTDIFGIAEVGAAVILGQVGDVTRFPTADRFAAYNGTAPIEWSSGNPKHPIRRLSRRGNRTLNHVIHIAAVTQIRHRHSPRPSVLRPQTRRRHDQPSSHPRIEATHQQHDLPAPRRRRRPAGLKRSGRATRDDSSYPAWPAEP
jgi:hypothetical protein